MNRIVGVRDQLDSWKELISPSVNNQNVISSSTTTITITTSSTIIPIPIPPPPTTTISPPSQTIDIPIETGVNETIVLETKDLVDTNINKTCPKMNTIDLYSICSNECGILINNILQKILPTLRKPPSDLPIIKIEKKEKTIEIIEPQLNLDQSLSSSLSTSLLPNNNNLQQFPQYPFMSLISVATSTIPVPSFFHEKVFQPPLNFTNPQLQLPNHRNTNTSHVFNNYQNQYHHQQHSSFPLQTQYLYQFQQFSQPITQSLSPPPPPPLNTFIPPPPPFPPKQKCETIVTVHPLITEFIVASISHYILHTFALKSYNFETPLKELLEEENLSIKKEKLELIIKTISVASIFLAGKV